MRRDFPVSKPHGPSRKFRAEKGTALFVAVGYLSAMTVGAAAFLSLYHSTFSQWQRQELAMTARYLADGGIQKAIQELRRSPESYRGEEDTPLGDGFFTVKVTKGREDGSFNLTSTGTLGDGIVVRSSREVRAFVRFGREGSVEELRWYEGPR